MIIGLDILLGRLRAGELITNLSTRELENPEGAGIDLRAGQIYRITSSGVLGRSERETSQIQLLGEFKESKPESVVLEPGEYYLVKIIEEITLDADMVGFFHPRSSLFRSGIILQTGVHAPGYSGAPTFGLFVAGKYPFTLELGARIAHINILRVQGKTSAYRGQWQGGRITTSGPETQI
jgi:deoxycytidine triphosphate deaminase